jgi:hypothetical protein
VPGTYFDALNTRTKLGKAVSAACKELDHLNDMVRPAGVLGLWALLAAGEGARWRAKAGGAGLGIDVATAAASCDLPSAGNDLSDSNAISS